MLVGKISKKRLRVWLKGWRRPGAFDNGIKVFAQNNWIVGSLVQGLKPKERGIR